MSLARTSIRKAMLPMATGVALLIVWTPCCPSRADSIAHFWLSNRDAGPETPVIYALPGAGGQIQIWARPAAGYRLAAFSLDLQAATTGVAMFSDVEVNNPQLQAMPPVYRHQLVFDTASGLEVTDGEIYGFLGYSFFDNAQGLPNGAGIGPTCGLDGECSAGSGSASWHVATVGYLASTSLGSTELFLAIGEQGLWQSPAGASEPDDPTDTSAVFGLANDAVNQWGVLVGMDHRHDPQGLPDAVIQVASADFDEDGDIDGGDLMAWQRGLGAGSTHADGDADGGGSVDSGDLAAWQFQFGATGVTLPVGSTVPEPTGMLVALWATGLVHAGRCRHRLAH